MKTTFTINAENSITAWPTPDHAEAAIGAGAQAFASAKEFGKVAAEWPISRFVEIWNGFAGTPGFDKLKEVKKFANRAKAVERIWAAIQVLEPVAAVAPDPPTPFDDPAPGAPAKAPRAGTKKDTVLRLLQRKDGASNQEIQAATEWQPHTVRGFIAGTLKKAGIVAESFKRENGDRAYRVG